MTIDYRPVREDELRDFIYRSFAGFGDNTGDTLIDRIRSDYFMKPEETLCAFVDGELAAQMGALPLAINWNGREIACGGVSAVSTMPTYRRRGLVRELMVRLFARMKEQEQPVAMLWASMAAIYQRFGYGIANTLMDYRNIDPRTVRFVEQVATPGRMRWIKVDEAYAAVGPTYDRFAAQRSVMVIRNERQWRNEVLRGWPPDGPPLLVAAYEEDGQMLGFVVYRIDTGAVPGPGPSQRLTVLLCCWLTPAAHRALVHYVLSHDLVGAVSFQRTPTDDPLLHLVEEPRLLQPTLRDGVLVRIVDLVAALGGRGYDADGRLCFAFPDELCPWNQGVWELSVENGTARVRSSSADPQLTLAPRALAMLASGHLSATRLAQAGLIPEHDPKALRTADALFRTERAPLCTDPF